MNDSTSKVIVSVDVEDWYHGPSVVPGGGAADQALESFLGANPDCERAYRYIDACLELLDRHGLTATFFWVAEYARRFPESLKRTAAAGHETACHGLAHRSKVDAESRQAIFSRDEFIRRTMLARTILEDISGQKVIGYRAPNAYVTGGMLDCLEEMGFRYDSSVSVNSLYNKTTSDLAGVTSEPYCPAPGDLRRGADGRRIVEFPWPYYSLFGVKIPSAGGPFLRFFGRGLISRGIRQSLRRGHAVFYFHPIDICREDFPFPFSLRRPFLWAMKGDVVKARIDRILAEFRPIATHFAAVLPAPAL